MVANALLSDELMLPCGATIPNRIAKAPMSEHQGRHFGPGERLCCLYERWSAGGAGLLISGNVMIDADHAESFRNVVLDEQSDTDAFGHWAAVGRAGGNHFWAQLNHAGRQTPSHVNAEPMAPSAVDPVDVFRKAKAFAMPRAMTEREIEDAIERFARAARVLRDSGFTGVQVHGAHGYLASQFLSPLTNKRTDQWGGSLDNRARFLRTVVKEIRRSVGDAFPIGVKLNSADFQRGGFGEEESIAVLQMLKEDTVDLVEVSGGSYEATTMFDGTESGTDVSGSTHRREAYFLDYAKKARRHVGVPLMLTGGMRSRAVMQTALRDGDIDLVGMARPFANNPNVAAELLNGSRKRADEPPPIPGFARFGGVATSMTSQVQISLISKGHDPTSAPLLAYETAASVLQEAMSLRKPRWARRRAAQSG